MFRKASRVASGCFLALALYNPVMDLAKWYSKPELAPSIVGDFDQDGKQDVLCRIGDSNEMCLVYDVRVENVSDGLEIKNMDTKKQGKPIKGRIKSRYLDGEFSYVSISDIDGDGNNDITICKTEKRRYSMIIRCWGLLGNGDNNFKLSKEHSGLEITGRPYGLGYGIADTDYVQPIRFLR